MLHNIDEEVENELRIGFYRVSFIALKWGQDMVNVYSVR